MYNIDELYSDIDFELVGDKIRMKIKGDTFRFKGYFTSETELKTNHPYPTPGSSAYVGANYPGVVYSCKTQGIWVNTNTAGSIPVPDLTAYARQTDLNTTNTEVGKRALQTDLTAANNKIVQLEQEKIFIENALYAESWTQGALQADGSVNSDANYKTSSYFLIEKNTSYCADNVRIMAQFNNSNIIQGTYSQFENVGVQFATREDALRVRFTVKNEFVGSFRLTKGLRRTSKAIQNGIEMCFAPEPASVKTIISSIINDSAFMPNLLEGKYDNILRNRLIDESGEIVPTQSNYVVSNFVDVQSDTLYSINFFNNTANYLSVVFYRSDKSKIAGSNLNVKIDNRGNRNLLFTTTSDTAYIKISSDYNTWNLVTLTEGIVNKMDNTKSVTTYFEPNPDSVKAIIEKNILVANENILSPDMFKFVGVISGQNTTRADSDWLTTDYIELDSTKSNLSHEYCRTVAYFDKDKNFIAYSNNTSRGFWSNCFFDGAPFYFGSTPTKKRPMYIRVTAKVSELHLVRMWYGSQVKKIDKDKSGNTIFAIPSPESPHFNDSIVNILNGNSVTYADGTIASDGGTVTEGGALDWKSSNLIDVSGSGRHLYVKRVRIIAEYDENMKFIVASYRMIGDGTGTGMADFDLLSQTKFIRVTVRKNWLYNAFIADTPLLNRVRELRQGGVETVFNPDPDKVREIAGSGSVDETQVNNLIDNKLGSYDFGQYVTQDMLNKVVTDQLLAEVAAQLGCTINDARAPQSGYNLFADSKDFKIWKPTGTPIRGLRGNWAIKYNSGSASFEITGGGLNGVFQTVNISTFPNLISGSTIMQVVLLGYDPDNDNPESGGLNLEKDVRCCVITDKGQLYHNKPKGYSSSDAHLKFDQSVVWDIEGRRLPSKTVDNDIYFKNPCLPDIAYEIHPGINVNTGLGNNGFPVQKTMGGVKYNRFYQHARAAQNIPFFFMGGFAQNHKIAVIGTYRANKSDAEASRICVFASCDGGRQWHNIQEYATDDSTNYGMVFNARGNKLNASSVENNYTTNSLCLQKVTLNLPTTEIPMPSTKFVFGDVKNIATISSTNGDFRVDTSTPHELQTGNRVVIKKTSSWVTSNYDFLVNDIMSAVSGGSQITFRVVVLSPTQVALFEYVHGADTNTPCRHIHAINPSKNNFVVSCGEIYPQGWISMLKVDVSDTWYPIGSLYKLPYVRLTSSQQAIQRALGTLVIDDAAQTVIFASDDASIPIEGLHNSTGIFKGRVSTIDNINKFEVIYPAKQVAYLFQEYGGLWVFCGQQGELAVSADMGKSWRSYEIGAIPLENPGGISNTGVVCYHGWLFYKK